MLTAAQLVSLACQICQCPGRTVQAGQMMNLILASYAQTMDLDTIRLTATLNIGPKTTIPYFYPLPTNYLRMYDMFYNVQGTTYKVEQLPLDDLDRQYTAQGINNYPEWYATDVAQAAEATAGSSPSIAFYPPPAIPITVNYRYRPQTTDIVAPETSASVPWFPNQLILLKEMCIHLGDVAGGEDRTPRWEKEIEKRTRDYLIMDDDKEGFAQTVKLDSRSFRNKPNLPPSKVLGF